MPFFCDFFVFFASVLFSCPKNIGASLKDLGKKWFGFVKLEQTTDELLSKM